MAKKTNKKKATPKISANEKYQFTMRMVTSDTCFSCKSQCARGLDYLEKMSTPGAIGKGVPCILTKGRAVGKR
ncbi:hypothetical protein [Halalkalibacter krulwichiae]|uniref:Uncharacterized protein n=1 Tax=Halalkalibacter krulwichiae TaxID=199441 RepID=A0A1X9MBP5_9BACI|nr:hypothetical protein [Halalkalibacter krulwichiae]ARK30889.1 hypothetical protein BkAM31D_14150 [Halalkalibacter krulwichiae]